MPLRRTNAPLPDGRPAGATGGGAPTAHHATHENGGSDEISVAGLSGVLADPQPPIIGAGATQAVAGNDARLTNARTPTAHATSHQPGGSDALAVDAAAATGSLRTLGTTATSAAAGNDSRLSDARTPTAHHASHEDGGSDELAVTDLGGFPGGTTNYLRADGAFATPPGSGGGGAHASTHENGGSDEISVAGLSGVLADPQPPIIGAGAAQAVAGNDARLTNARTPTAHATSHQPGGSDALAVDAAAATGSLRTLGTTATSAAAGNDSRLSDARTPTAHHASHENGGADEITVAGLSGVLADPQPPIIGAGATEAVAGNDARLTNARTPTAHATSHQPGGSDALAVDAAAATGSLRTLGTTSTSAAAGNDSRLSDARTPTAHATSHQPGGSDALAVDAAAATGSLRTLGTTSTSAAAGNDSRLSDARTPTAHATSHKSGGSDAIKLDELAAPTDITTLNVSTSAHGLAPKLPNDATKFLNGLGVYAVPAGSGGGSPTEQTTTATGTQNDFSLTGGSFTYLRCTGAAPVFTGFTVGGSAPSAGDRVVIECLGTSAKVTDQGGGSTAANRIACPASVGQIVGASGRMELVYDGTSSRWREACLDPGAPLPWTPVIGGSSSTSGQTYESQNGRATQRGRLVTLECAVRLSAKGTISGVVQIQGVPFAPGIQSYVSAAYLSLITNWVNIAIDVSGSTAFNVEGATAAATTNRSSLGTADLGNSSAFYFQATYSL